MALKLDVTRAKDIAVVRCRGRIVFGEEADELTRVILDSLNKTRRIVLDFAWVEYLDRSGMGILVASLIFARHRGAEIKLAALGPKARQVPTTPEVDRLFGAYGSAEEAIKSVLTQKLLPASTPFRQA
jgi:anti-anti-sigma factor